MEYDPAVIEEFASRLYYRARSLLVVYGLVGFVIGAVLFFGASQATSGGEILGVIALIFATLIGAAYGREKGFMLRLQAQQALCQVAMERNTRGAGTGDVRSVSGRGTAGV